MADSDVQEIVPGIWCWQRRPRGLRASEFGGRTSYALAVNGETLLVDCWWQVMTIRRWRAG